MVSAAFLGWPFALFKVASATVTGIAGGMLAHFWGEKGSVSSASPAAKQVTADAFPGGRLRSMLDHGIQIVRSIWYWLVFGIVVSAASEGLEGREEGAHAGFAPTHSFARRYPAPSG